MAIGSATLRYKLSEAAPNIYRMGWRRFVNEFLLVSPLVFLACITVQARTQDDNFHRLEYSASLNQKISAYIEPVRLVQDAISNETGAQAAQIRNAAEVWRDRSRSGVLKPLLPEVPGDSTRDGIKGQIRAAADELGAWMHRLARSSMEAGDYMQASSDALLSLEALQTIKYSDLYSVGQLSTRQNASLALLAESVDKLTPSQRESLVPRFELLRESEKSIADLVLAEHRLWTADEQTIHWTRSSRRSLDLMLKLAVQMDEDRANHQLKDIHSELKKLGRGGEIESVFPSLRFAWNARRNGNENWRIIETKLSQANAG